MINASAREIVESYRTALGKGDFASARNLMQDNMVFEGPLDTFNKADDYLAANKRLASIIQRITSRRCSLMETMFVCCTKWSQTPLQEQLLSRNGTRSRGVRSHTFELYS